MSKANVTTTRMNTTSTSGGNKKIPANMMKNFKMNPMTRTKTSASFWKKFLGLSELMKSFTLLLTFSNQSVTVFPIFSTVTLCPRISSFSFAVRAIGTMIHNKK